nr:amino acid--tRNA ligase-related protein [Mycoplasmopsis bovis]
MRCLAHHPFTRFAHTLDELDKLSIDKINAIAYDLVLNGFEIAGGSARIYDKNMQEKMFNLIGLTKEQQESKFGWFLKSFWLWCSTTLWYCIWLR